MRQPEPGSGRSRDTGVLRSAALRVLIVEDSADDADLLAAQLTRAGQPVTHRRVDNAAAMKDALFESDWDIVISDHSMPVFSSSGALQVLRQSGRDIPFIIYSGCISEQVLAAAHSDGVGNCIAKGHLDELVPAMERELLAHGRGRRHVAANLVHLADYDRTTGLPGRALFMRQAGRRLEEADTDEHVAVCFIDIARFMRVNQTLGYETADRVLAQIGRRLRAGSPEGLVTRYAGDKFVVVCGGFTSVRQVQALAERLGGMLAESCSHEGLQLHLASSMGISVFPDDGLTLRELMLHAETAMFQCKRLLGCNGFLFYFRGMDGHTGRHLALESALWNQRTVAEFFLLYQPIIALDTGKVVAVEALMRWRHPQLGVLLPESFIPLADENGLMGRIGEWVLAEACRQLRAWRDQDGAVIRVSVNVSASQFNQHAFLERVSGVLRESQIAPGLLTLEITESVLMRDSEASLLTLRALKDMGLRIAIDDFGAGYSSFGYLRRYPVDVLKIDSSFIGGIAGDARDAAITRAIIELGRSLGLRVVAEGVETAGQAACLSAYGCEYAQGLFYSKPIPAEDIPASIQSRAVDNFRSDPR